MTANFRNLYNSHGFYDANSIEKNSFRSWFPARGLTGDQENINNRQVINRAWDLFRNNSTTRSILNTAGNGVIGTGLKVGPNIDYKTLKISKSIAKELNSDIARYFNLWANSEMSCVDRKNNFNMLQMRIFLNFWLSGGCFAVLRSNSNISEKKYPFDLSIQGIDYDMASNPNNSLDTQKIAGGIETNDFGEEIAYHFKKINSNSMLIAGTTETIRIPKFGKTGRRNVLHVHTPVRFNERLGISMLAPVMEPLKQLDRYDKSELMATIVSSFFTAFIESEDAADFGEDIDERNIGLASGNVAFLRPGENVSFANPNRPNANFKDFEDAFLIKVSSFAGLPVEMVKKKYDSSYTAARAALLQAFHQFKIDRQNFSFCFNQPIYEEFVTEIALKGIVNLEGYFSDELKKTAWLRTNWVGDSMGLIDPVKELTAAKMARQEQIKTSDEISREITGKPYLENLELLDDENQERKDRGMLFPDEYERETKRIDAERKVEVISGD